MHYSEIPKRHRARIDGLSKDQVHSDISYRALMKAKKLEKERDTIYKKLEKTRIILQANCPHKLDAFDLDTSCEWDTLGNFKATNFHLKCGDCETTLATWSE